MKVLSALIGRVKVTCLDRKCADGQSNTCDAALSQEGELFKLVTGIAPSADYLGSATFKKEDILDGSVIKVHFRDGQTTRMVLEPRTE